MTFHRVRAVVGVASMVLVAGAVGAPASTQAGSDVGPLVVKQYVPSVYTAVSAASPSDVWAVGNTYSYDDDADWRALIKHWDGQRWTRTPGPQVPGRESLYLNGVAAVGPDDAWAVGDLLDDSASLIAHWDGRSWLTVASPQPGSLSALNAIVAISSTDVWAAGAYWLPGRGVQRPLLLHWDGVSWQRVPDDSAGVGFSAQAYGVTAHGPSDVWLVGATQEQRSAQPQTFIEHWDGAAWHRVPSPNANVNRNELEAVSASSATDAWAVGSFDDLSTTKPLSLHWDGQRWRRVLMQHRQRTAVYIHGVSAETPSQVWAVGQKFYTGGNGYRAVAERWDGSLWQTFRSENPPGFVQTVLRAVSFASDADGWAVGNFSADDGYNVPLIERWDGLRWNRVDE